jgi:membrane fusion protein (multidrug efflux system)
MFKQMTVMLFVVGVFFGGLFGWKAYQTYQTEQRLSNQPMPAVTVSTTVASVENWTPIIPSVGSLRASQGVDITAQEAGVITALRFESGAKVRQGDLLAQQYVADEQARLEALEADVKLAELNLERALDLLEKNLISQFDYDTRKTDRDRVAAEARSVRLIIEKKSIRAPFSGRIGIRQVNLGQYLEPGDSIVRLEAVDKMLVDFPVPQRFVSRLREGQPLMIRVDAWPGKDFHGRISAIAPQIRAATRDVRVEGIIGNEAEQLLPGMFVEVGIQLPVREEVVTLPQSAITFSPYGDSVFAVEEATDANGEVMFVAIGTSVETGETRGDQVAILSGVRPGDTVVTAGQIKLREGTRVLIDNSVLVSNQPASTPENN